MIDLTKLCKMVAVASVLCAFAGCGGGGVKPKVGGVSSVNQGSSSATNNDGNTNSGGGSGTVGDERDGANTDSPTLTVDEIAINSNTAFVFNQDVDDRSDKVVGLFEFSLRDVTNGRYIRDLNNSNMTFKERQYGSDGAFQVEVEATQSSGLETTQIDLMYLLDNSFSVVQAGASSELIEQANNLANEINIRNSASGAVEGLTRYRTFADGVGPLQTSTSDNPFESVQFEDQGGGTALYQGIELALTDLATSRQPVLFVFTDGRENASRPGYDLNLILNTAQQNQIPVYIAGLGNVDSATLSQIATTTGGQFFQADSVDQLSEVFEDILYSIPVEYTVTYRPTQRAGHVEFQFVVDYNNAADLVVGDFNVDSILTD